jgi:hypothetical protein
VLFTYVFEFDAGWSFLVKSLAYRLVGQLVLKVVEWAVMMAALKVAKPVALMADLMDS